MFQGKLWSKKTHHIFNPSYFYATRFSNPLAPNEVMPNISKDHMSWATCKNQVRVPTPNEMFSTTTWVTRTNVRMLKSQGVDKRLNP
jgi:hypothetical protein